MPVVVGLSFMPVKATRLHTVEALAPGVGGVRENRRFYVIDERDRMINSEIEGGREAVNDLRRYVRLGEVDAVKEIQESGGLVAECGVLIGQSVISYSGQVGRGLVSSREHASGVLDLPTLDILFYDRTGLDRSEL